MADKGFHTKILIPTDDGLTISENGIGGVKYFLLYNVSNRSYQLAGKIKTEDLIMEDDNFNDKINEIILNEKIDKIVGEDQSFNLKCNFIKNSEIEIDTFISNLIDILYQE